MCAERVEVCSKFKHEYIMFHKCPNINTNVYIQVKFMKEGWWQKQRCDHVSFDRDLHAEGAVCMRKERQLDLES